MKKHLAQMQPEEIIYLRNKINSITQFYLTEHCQERMREKKVNKKQTLQTLINYSVVEYHRKGLDDRVLLRGIKRYGNDNVCILVSLCNQSIITVYRNDNRDRHSTIDWEQYSDDIDIIDLIDNNTYKFDNNQDLEVIKII